MLITEESNKKIPTEDEEYDDYNDRKPQKQRREREYHDDRPQKKRHSCAKAFGCFIIFLIIIAVIVYIAFKFFIGPVVSAVDKLPNNFPKELVLYNADQAKIKVQTPTEKATTENILNHVPDWLSSPFLTLLSTNPQTQLATKTPEGIKLPDKINIQDFKNYFQNPELKKLTTVSASWLGVDRKKDELAEFYRKQLINKGFQMKENIDDYNIDLSFWKDDVFGIIKINDSATKGASDANITVNYSAK